MLELNACNIHSNHSRKTSRGSDVLDRQATKGILPAVSDVKKAVLIFVILVDLSHAGTGWVRQSMLFLRLFKNAEENKALLI